VNNVEPFPFAFNFRRNHTSARPGHHPVGPYPFGDNMSTEQIALQTMRSQRVVHEFTQLNHGTPALVFSLLCPVREAEWLPRWKYRLVCSQSGVAELGCVFTTPNDDGSETIWVITRHDPINFEIEFAWVCPQLLATRLEISLTPGGPDRTHSRIRYTYTALSPAGEREIERMDSKWFEHRMRDWETAINHYLDKGRIISGPEQEE
jgi:hypothetical protein